MDEPWVQRKVFNLKPVFADRYPQAKLGIRQYGDAIRVSSLPTKRCLLRNTSSSTRSFAA